MISWPVRKEPYQSWPLVVGIVIFSMLVTLALRHFSYGLISLTVLILASWRAWVPVTFEIGPLGISSHFITARLIPWKRIRRIDFTSGGILVFPVHETTVLRYFLGIFVPWNNQEAAIRDAIKLYAPVLLPPQHLQELEAKRTTPAEKSHT